MKSRFFLDCQPEKTQVEFYPIFFWVAKAPIFSKLKIGCRLKDWLCNNTFSKQTILQCLIWARSSIKTLSNAPLICTLKSDFEVATWGFLRHELEKIKVNNHPYFFLGRHLMFFWFTLWNPAFSHVANLKKLRLNSTLFFSGWWEHPAFQN